MKTFLKSRASSAALAAAFAVAIGSAAHAGDISGRVVSTTEASGLEGARVVIPELDRGTTTDRDGRYSFSGLPAGDYTVEVSYIGAADASAGVSVGATDAVTQDFALAALQTERILVIGQRGSLYDALNQRRAADNLIDVLSSDAIGQFPDQNVSEAARRVAGVSVENDQGEGRFIVIRGIDPNLNASNVNGVRIPAPENDIRAVALDVVDSEVLEGIIVTRSLTPDQDGDAIGGTIDIRTTTAFDRDGLFLSARLGGSYNELTDRIGPRVGLSASNIFANGQFGVSGSLSYRERTFATENMEVDGEWLLEGDSLWNEEVEFRDYLVTRTRANASLNFDFRPNADHDFFLRTLYSEFEDQEYRRRLELKLDDADIISAADDIVLFGGEIEIDRDSKDRLETQNIWSLQAGGESRLDAWTLNYLLAYSHAEEDEPNSLDTVTFRGEFEDDGFIGLNSSNPLRPQVIRSVTDPIAIDDPLAYEIDAWELVNGFTEDDEFTARFDARRDFVFDGMDTFVQSGFSYRDREKSYDAEVSVFEGPDDFTLASVATSGIDYPFDPYGPFVDSTLVRDYFNANRDTLDVEDDDTLIASIVEDYTADETITAAYLMGGVDTGRFSIVGGVRVEQTDFSADAFQVLISDTDDDIFVSPVSLDRNYQDILPSVNLRYEVADDVVLRAAYYSALARPTFGQLVPRAEIEEDGGEYEGEGGNPDLNRQRAENFDFGVEWYTGNNGILSAGVFYKNIDDYIAPILFEGVDYQGLQLEELSTYVNLDSAEVWGLELNYQQALEMLPAPFDNFIVGANLTLLEGTSELADGREISLPKLSDTLANLVLGYQNDLVDLRLSYAYRSEYLDEINGGFADGLDRFVDSHGQLDFTANIDVTDNLRFYTELTNITDEPFLAYVDLENGERALLQYEEYGYTAQFGLRYRY